MLAPPRLRFFLAVLLLLPSCGGLAVQRSTVTLVSPSWEVECHVWTNHDLFSTAGHMALWDTLLFPVDGVLSLVRGGWTLFDSRAGVQGGALGVLAAALLPLTTCAEPRSGARPFGNLPVSDAVAEDPKREMLKWQGFGMKFQRIVEVEEIRRRARVPGEEEPEDAPERVWLSVRVREMVEPTGVPAELDGVRILRVEIVDDTFAMWHFAGWAKGSVQSVAVSATDQLGLPVTNWAPAVGDEVEVLVHRVKWEGRDTEPAMPRFAATRLL